MKIYVASSWRNPFQQSVVEALRAAGHEVYDFRNPAEGDKGFHWSEIDPNWKEWAAAEFRGFLDHPIAERGFGTDMRALVKCDACVLVMPCGRSAHLEAGYAIGAGKPTAILLSDGEPELMYKMAVDIHISLEETVIWANRVSERRERERAGDQVINRMAFAPHGPSPVRITHLPDGGTMENIG